MSARVRTDHANSVNAAWVQGGDALAGMDEAAVIDVGSNSVRLVVYRIDGRAMTPFVNEKVMAGLGRDLIATGKLSADGVEAAILALKRFRVLLNAMGVSHLDAVATAAVREASDGAQFTRRVEREAGIKLRVIAGSEEARLAALGVLAGEPEAEGVVGDLGGSSLELVSVTPKGPGVGETFPLGPFSLMGKKFDAVEIAAIADEALAASKVLPARGDTFYAVGGAWRALGRIDIALRDHPIHVLHHHEMTRAGALRVVEFVQKQSKKSLERLEEAAAKRADSLPYAAVVLERVLRRGGFSRVILSSYGVREGLLYEHLSQRSRSAHPLIAAAEAFGAPSERMRAFGAALEKWVTPVLVKQPPVFGEARDSVIRAAAARLADLGAALHPDQRSELIFDMVLRAPFAAIAHAERAFLATAVHHRYAKAPPTALAYAKLLSEDQRNAAAALGFALRLGADLSGRARALLNDFTLTLERGQLVLTVKPQRAHLLTEQNLKRLEPLAQTLGVTSKVVR
jgi:exopolyphosphatase / guanosine-5'-triphosphate,3'-diphosphate pyrophosphatase